MSDSIEALRTVISGAKALIVCGAGVSRAVTGGAAPGWKGLIESAIDSAPKEPGEDWSDHCREGLTRNDPDVWLNSANIAQTKLGGFKSNDYRVWLKNNVGKLKANEPALLDAIIALDCRLATTNYDGLLCTKKGAQPKTWLSPESVAEILSGESSNVWHIHGYWEEPESVVFSNADYDRVNHSDRAQFLQRQAAFADTLVFVGCSADGLADQNVGRLLKWFSSLWGGLGKKHVALVTDDEVATPGWPDNVTLVSYGPKHEKLPEFLRSLAPENSGPQASAIKVNRIDLAIANPHPVGRRDEINRVVTAATEGRPCIITGGPGMGKTTVAVAASYDERLTEKFGERRVFVNLENRTDPLDVFILLAAELGLSPEPTQSATLAAIRYSCGQESAFAILDNVEGLIEADEPETSRILSLLRDTAGLSFVVTSREGLPFLLGWTKIDDLSPLPLDESRDLFCGIATNIRRDDPDLPPLLAALDGHALSLTIMASRVDSDLTLGPMLRRWEDEKAELLRQPGAQENRHNSVMASLRVSLTSRRLSPMANRLLAILGFLPDGIPPGGMKAFLGREDRQISAAKSDAATDSLRQLRLIAPRPDGSIKLLNPLREAVSIEKPLRGEELQRVVRAVMKLLEKGKNFGTTGWPAAEAELLPHLRNFAPVLLQAARDQPVRKLRQAIESARLLSASERRFDQTTFLKLALILKERSASESKSAAAQAVHAAGHLALRRDASEQAQTHFEEARDICLQIGDRLGQANALRSLGDLAARRHDLNGARNYFEEARDICLQIGDRLGQANALRSLGDLAARRHDLDGAQTLLEEARDIYLQIGERLGQANTLRSLGDLAEQRDDLNDAQTHFERAGDIYLHISDRLGQANALRSLGSLALRRSDLVDAQTHLEEARDLYLQISDRLGQAQSLQSLGDLALRRDDLNGAQIHLEEARDICLQIGDRLGQANALQLLGNLALRRDDLNGAQTLLEEARDICLQVGNRLGQANALQLLGNLALRRDDLNGAQTLLEEARDICLQVGNRLGQANALQSLGNLALRRDDLNGAQTLLEEARDICLQVGDRLGQANTLQALGDLALRLYNLDAAQAYLQEARAIYQKVTATLGEANANYLIGEVQLRLDPVRAETIFTQVLQSYESLGVKWGIAHSNLRLAQITARQGDRSRLADAVDKILRYEEGDPAKLAAPGWRAFCASLLEHDEAKRAALCDQARRLWTEIGALGLIKDYVDFEISVAVADHTNAED
jgi:tetratricopeptide (TPR) repeat protein